MSCILTDCELKV